jgi:putative Ca2+/H+ antiporter (TMEM165/GDT1 family)
LSIFFGAAAALIIVTLLAVLVGGVLTEYIPAEWLQRIVAAAFIIIGILMFAGKL